MFGLVNRSMKSFGVLAAVCSVTVIDHNHGALSSNVLHVEGLKLSLSNGYYARERQQGYDDANTFLAIRSYEEFQDNYKMLHKLGSGNFGSVWKVQGKKTGVERAVKIMKMSSQANVMEIKIMQHLKKCLDSEPHPNIIQPVDLFATKNKYFLVLELGSMNLDKSFRRYERSRTVRGVGIDIERIKNKMESVFSAIQYLHNHGIVHRDIKGANFVVGRDGNLKIIDFGLAVILPKKKPGVCVKLSGRAGSSLYMAPEVMNRLCYDEKADIWSAGVLMVEMFVHMSDERIYKDIFKMINRTVGSIMSKPKRQQVDNYHEYNSLINDIRKTIDKNGRPVGVNSSVQQAKGQRSDAHKLILQLFTYDPATRPGAVGCLNHLQSHSQWFLQAESAGKVNDADTHVKLNVKPEEMPKGVDVPYGVEEIDMPKGVDVPDMPKGIEIEAMPKAVDVPEVQKYIKIDMPKPKGVDVPEVEKAVITAAAGEGAQEGPQAEVNAVLEANAIVDHMQVRRTEEYQYAALLNVDVAKPNSNSLGWGKWLTAAAARFWGDSRRNKVNQKMKKKALAGARERKFFYTKEKAKVEWV